jgi:hypothetical protein
MPQTSRLLAVVAAAVLLPAVASAQTTRRTRPPTKQPAAAPAPVAPVAPVAPAAAPAPAPAAAPAPIAARRPAEADDEYASPVVAGDPPAPWFFDREWRVSVQFGLEAGLGDQSFSAPKLRVDASTTLRKVSPRATAGLVLSLSALHASDTETFTVATPYGADTIGVEWAANVFDFVPSARLTFAAAPRFWMYGDAGLGLSYTAALVSIDIPELGRLEPVGDGIAVVGRLAGGLLFSPTANARLGAELGANLRFGDGVGSSLSILAVASHRF